MRNALLKRLGAALRLGVLSNCRVLVHIMSLRSGSPSFLEIKRPYSGSRSAVKAETGAARVSNLAHLKWVPRKPQESETLHPRGTTRKRLAQQRLYFNAITDYEKLIRVNHRRYSECIHLHEIIAFARGKWFNEVTNTFCELMYRKNWIIFMRI